MELKTNYQYTYFIYPFAINKKEYLKYIKKLIIDKRFEIKFFDTFKDIDMYKYFVPNIKEKMFQNFTFNKEKIDKIRRFSIGQQIKIFSEQKCLIFDYLLEEQILGKAGEQDGIFFGIPKIELICFDTGICFLAIKTVLTDSSKFSDILNFNYKFKNINLENKNIKKIKNIKIQTNMFNTMNAFLEVIEDIIGRKAESNKIDIDENMFLAYTYVCVNSNCWNEEKNFENIENEFIKLAEIKQSDTNVNMEFEKLSILSNSKYMKMRANDKGVALICSSADKDNFTKLPEMFENQYLYTYIIALHQRYYLKKINKEFDDNPRAAIKNFLNFSNDTWINEATTDSFGQKLYKRLKEKLNLEVLFNEVKNKYDIFYKSLNIEKNKKINIIALIIFTASLIISLSNMACIAFYK